VQGLVAAKPPESSKPVRWGTKSNVVRGGCRKTSAEEMDLSMEGAPDRALVRSSRVSLRSDLGVVRVCGPMRRDSQAGTSARRDRRVTGSVDDGRRGRKRLYVRARRQLFASIHQSHLGVVKTLGARSCVRREATPPGRAANTESVKNPWARDAISSRANEARVLEIEAVDGRNRSYAPSVWSRRRRKTELVAAR